MSTLPPLGKVKSSHPAYYVKKFIMIGQRKKNMELFGESNYPIMLDAYIMKNVKDWGRNPLLKYTLG